MGKAPRSRNTKLPGVWELPSDDPRRVELERLEHEYLKRNDGRWTYRSIQKFADVEAAKLGIRARRFGGTLTIESTATPMGIPPQWPVAKIRDWKGRAARGEPLPWIVRGPDGRYKGIEWRPVSRPKKRGKISDALWDELRGKGPHRGAIWLHKQLRDRGTEVDRTTVSRRLKKERSQPHVK